MHLLSSEPFFSLFPLPISVFFHFRSFQTKKMAIRGRVVTRNQNRNFNFNGEQLWHIYSLLQNIRFHFAINFFSIMEFSLTRKICCYQQPTLRTLLNDVK